MYSEYIVTIGHLTRVLSIRIGGCCCTGYLQSIRKDYSSMVAFILRLMMYWMGIEYCTCHESNYVFRAIRFISVQV
ncbi:Uncharacterised protein [Enterobacter cloacae]|uniref:Uncharacterized protein n=1 Tax=Enterobacter cloacae TaxID=550 RepID=A0A377M8I0_ENTCL|nr:Uncharacterised protein [Enterobacter cloacae]